VRHKASDSLTSECVVSTIPQCLEWHKLTACSFVFSSSAVAILSVSDLLRNVRSVLFGLIQPINKKDRKLRFSNKQLQISEKKNVGDQFQFCP